MTAALRHTGESITKRKRIAPVLAAGLAVTALSGCAIGPMSNPTKVGQVTPQLMTPLVPTDADGHPLVDPQTGKKIVAAECDFSVAAKVCQYSQPGQLVITTGGVPTYADAAAKVLGGVGSAATGVANVAMVPVERKIAEADQTSANAQVTYANAAAQGQLATKINAANGGTVVIGNHSSAEGGNVSAVNSTVATNGGTATSTRVNASGGSVVAMPGSTLNSSGQSVIGGGRAGSNIATGQSEIGSGTAGSNTTTTTNTASGQSVIGSGTAGSITTKTTTTTNTNSDNNCSTTVTATGGQGNASGAPNVGGGCGGSTTNGGAYGNQTLQSSSGQSTNVAGSPYASGTAGSITGTTTTNSTTQSGSTTGAGTTLQTAPGTTAVPAGTTAAPTTTTIKGDTGAFLEMPKLPFDMPPKAYAALEDNRPVVVLSRDGSATLYTAFDRTSDGRPAMVRRMTFENASPVIAA